MPRTRELLDRFRASGAPGAAGGRGVPADRVTERSTELGPVLDLLADTVEQCERIRTEARQQADLRQRRGHERALAVEASARRQSEAVRADTAAEAARRAAHETEELMARSREELQIVHARVEDRMQAHVDAVVEGVRALLLEEGQ